jgi:hypothetical protein
MNDRKDANDAGRHAAGGASELSGPSVLLRQLTHDLPPILWRRTPGVASRGITLFQALDQPATRQAWRRIHSVRGRHRYPVAVRRHVLKLDLDQLTACDILLDETGRHAAPPERGTEERVFRPQVRQPPRPG